MKISMDEVRAILHEADLEDDTSIDPTYVCWNSVRPCLSLEVPGFGSVCILAAAWRALWEREGRDIEGLNDMFNLACYNHDPKGDPFGPFLVYFPTLRVSD